MKALKIYIGPRSFVRVPVDQHWIEIAQTIRQLWIDFRTQYPDEDHWDKNPWKTHWNEMYEPRYYAGQCVDEILGPDFDFDFDINNDYMDLEDALEAILDGRDDPMLVEIELAVA
jgi:hypothetical protein